jgi:hypothetical protein
MANELPLPLGGGPPIRPPPKGSGNSSKAQLKQQYVQIHPTRLETDAPSPSNLRATSAIDVPYHPHWFLFIHNSYPTIMAKQSTPPNWPSKQTGKTSGNNRDNNPPAPTPPPAKKK